MNNNLVTRVPSRDDSVITGPGGSEELPDLKQASQLWSRQSSSSPTLPGPKRRFKTSTLELEPGFLLADT